MPEVSLAREIHRLLEQGDPEGARNRLEAAAAGGSSGESPALIQLLMGEIHEHEGLHADAILAFSTVGGREGGDAVHAFAWDGVARVRRATGDERAAVRASMRAWDLAPAELRAERTPSLRVALRRLGEADLRILEGETRHLDAHALIQGSEGRTIDGPGNATVTLLAPFTGRFEKFAEAFRDGAQLALEEHGDSADRRGPRVELSLRDTKESAPIAAREARAAIVDDGCVAILGPLLSVTSASAGAVAQAFGVPILAPTATDPEIAAIGSMVLTFDPALSSLVEPLAEFAVRSLGARTFGVLMANEGTNAEFEAAFHAAVIALGAQVAVSIAYEPDETDFRKLIERLEEANVDAVYIPGTAAHIEALATQLDFYDFRRRVLGNGGWTHPRVLDAGSLAIEGAIFAVEAVDFPESDFMRHLSQSIWSRTGQEVSRFHVRGYQSMSSLLAVLDQGALLGEEIAEAIRLRRYWPEATIDDGVYLLTYRDGVLGPARWATGFDLTPLEDPSAADGGPADGEAEDPDDPGDPERARP